MFSLIGHLIAKEFYTIMLKIYYVFYKHIFYTLFKFNVIKHNINIIVKDDKGLALSIEQTTIDKINEIINKNEEYLKNFNIACIFISVLNSWFIPQLQKYLKKSIKNDYKKSKYISDFINKFVNETCTYKNKKFVDKYIVQDLRKAKFYDSTEEENENKRKFILDNLIVFSQIDSENYKNILKVEFEENDFKDVNILVNKLMNLQILRAYYIAEYVKEHRMDEKHKFGDKLSNNLIHNIKHNLGYDVDIKGMLDYEIIDSIMKTL